LFCLKRVATHRMAQQRDEIGNACGASLQAGECLTDAFEYTVGAILRQYTGWPTSEHVVKLVEV
jgi:hypothetical protein